MIISDDEAMCLSSFAHRPAYTPGRDILLLSSNGPSFNLHLEWRIRPTLMGQTRRVIIFENRVAGSMSAKRRMGKALSSLLPFSGAGDTSHVRNAVYGDARQAVGRPVKHHEPQSGTQRLIRSHHVKWQQLPDGGAKEESWGQECKNYSGEKHRPLGHSFLIRRGVLAEKLFILDWN
jgi:hypothetical protein